MIELRLLTKRYGAVEVLSGLSLDVAAHSFVSIVAPSGSGKTTLLRLIAGLEKPTSGSICLLGAAIDRLTQPVGYVFQQESCFPWLTVEENLSFGLRLDANRSSITQSNVLPDIRRTAGDLGIDHLLSRFPAQLSGGQSQRVVIGRALVLKPQILLFDEPLSALDEVRRQELRDVVRSVHQLYEPTVVFVTHNIEEAIYLSQRVLVCTGPPLTVCDDIEITLGNQRDASTFSSPAFAVIATRIRTSLASHTVNTRYRQNQLS